MFSRHNSHGPHFAIDRISSFHSHYGFYRSEATLRPWFMTILGDQIYLKKVIIHNRQSGQNVEANRFKNISVRAGLEKVNPNEKLGSVIEENEVCSNLNRPGGIGEKITFSCAKIKPVRVITVQIINEEKDSILQFDEIEFIEESKFITVWTK